ncbi:NAD(P)-dependent oxidoreductase [Paenibacillus flagellatus]|uniref:NADH-flavin reductase n=1 Tax=Paenibacillus flagellatus TaxID=2211139 RepID=A0A2V5KXM7_9BACL|nr:SDR family oxidoreductase [Paenibacillus flagellatus]PYI54616.1 NADH-flavin reductase [Paenibacillus flagellatus]
MEKRTGKMAVIGGTGKVGRAIVKQALEDGYAVRMLARNPERVTAADSRLAIVQGDARDRAAIASLLADCDVVINAFGQPNKETFPLYSLVTGQIVEIMKEKGIRRYIGVTGASLDVPGDRKSIPNRIGAALFRLSYPAMMKDKAKELAVLRNSDADWTLFRISFVTEGPAIGRIRFDEGDMPGLRVRSADLARFIVGHIQDSRFVRAFPFVSN